MKRTPTSPAWIANRWLIVLILAAITIGALFLRIRMALINQWPTVDGVYYMGLAKQLVTTGKVAFSCFPPGWPFIISVPLLFLDKDDPLTLFRAAQAANVICGTLLPFLGFMVLRPDLGRRVALLGAAVLAFLPLNIILSKGDLSETSFTCGLLGAWLLFRRRSLLAAGLLFGFTYLIRPEAVLAAIGLTLHQWHADRRIPWPMVVGLAVPILPYLIFIRAASGVWGLSSKDVALSLSLTANPGLSYLGLVASNCAKLAPMLPGLLGLPLVLLATVGLVARRGRWLWMLAPFLPVPFIINPMVVRFWHPLLPFLLLAAGLGRAWVTRLAGGRSWVAGLAVVLALGGLAVAVRDDLPMVRTNTEAYTGLRDAGSWLSERVNEDTIIAAYKPYTSFWAGCKFIQIPDEDNVDAIISWARNHGAEFLVVNVVVTHSLAPGLDPLLQRTLPERLAKRLTLVQLFEYNIVDQNTAIYRIENPFPH